MFKYDARMIGSALVIGIIGALVGLLFGSGMFVIGALSGVIAYFVFEAACKMRAQRQMRLRRLWS